MKVAHAETLIVDKAEHFQKMTLRNRYHISGANKPILLSVPLTQGRNQHTPMAEVQIYNKERWQVQHWRTLVSVYNRSPFFEHYELALRPLFETEFTSLLAFNTAAMQWAKRQLRLKFEEKETSEFIRQYPDGITDIRFEAGQANTPHYYQVFEDRIGFQPDLSILDLLFSEGPRAIDLLRG
jgi:hypothetical protein